MSLKFDSLEDYKDQKEKCMVNVSGACPQHIGMILLTRHKRLDIIDYDIGQSALCLYAAFAQDDLEPLRKSKSAETRFLYYRYKGFDKGAQKDEEVRIRRVAFERHGNWEDCLNDKDPDLRRTAYLRLGDLEGLSKTGLMIDAEIAAASGFYNPDSEVSNKYANPIISELGNRSNLDEDMLDRLSNILGECVEFNAGTAMGGADRYDMNEVYKHLRDKQVSVLETILNMNPAEHRVSTENTALYYFRKKGYTQEEKKSFYPLVREEACEFLGYCEEDLDNPYINLSACIALDSIRGIRKKDCEPYKQNPLRPLEADQIHYCDSVCEWSFIHSRKVTGAGFNQRSNDFGYMNASSRRASKLILDVHISSKAEDVANLLLKGKDPYHKYFEDMLSDPKYHNYKMFTLPLEEMPLYMKDCPIAKYRLENGIEK